MSIYESVSPVHEVEAVDCHIDDVDGPVEDCRVLFDDWNKIAESAYELSRYYGATREEQEDNAQDWLLRRLEKGGLLIRETEDVKLGPLVSRGLCNASRDRWRKEKRRPSFATDFDDDRMPGRPFINSAIPDPEATVMGRVLEPEIETAVRELPDYQQDVLLADSRGESPEEQAEKLGISPITIRTRRLRGRDKVLNKLNS